MIIGFFIFADNENDFGDRALIGGTRRCLEGWYMTWRGEGGVGALAGYPPKVCQSCCVTLPYGCMFFVVGKDVTMDAPVQSC